MLFPASDAAHDVLNSSYDLAVSSAAYSGRLRRTNGRHRMCGGLGSTIGGRVPEEDEDDEEEDKE